MRLSNRRLACLAIAISALLPLGTAADNPAKRPVVILVGFAAGGGTDITARLVADSMQSALGRSVIVENKPGAGGGIAAVALKNAAPDGTTIMFAPTAVPVMAPLISRHLDYDPARDFAPVAQVATFQVAFAVSPESSATSIQEFMAWAKMHGNQANFGTVAAGSLPHLFGREVARLAGVDMVHIAYKGFPQLSGDLMGGRIPAVIDALPSLVELHRAGKVRIIATSGAARSSLTPAVATFAEQGYPALVSDSWIGVFAPASTSRAVVDALSRSIADSLRAPALRDSLAKRGYDPTGTSADELAAAIASDTSKWAPIVKASGRYRRLSGRTVVARLNCRRSSSGRWRRARKRG